MGYALQHMRWFDELLNPACAQLAAYTPHRAAPEVLRLDANELSLPLPPPALERLASALAAVDLRRYPDARATELREALALAVGAAPEQLVLGSGSDEVIALLLATLNGARGRATKPVCLYPSPTFVMYRASALAAGLEPHGVALASDWQLDVQAMLDALARLQPSVLFLASPNNPTAARFRDDDVETLVRACEGRTLVVLDEAYGAYAVYSYRALRERYSHVAQLGTLSKVGFAGARVGWAVLPAALAAEVDKLRQPYNLSSLAQCAALAALGPLADDIADAVAAVRTERDRLVRACGHIAGVTAHRTDANFLWIDCGRDAAGVHSSLASRGVLVRSFHGSASLDARLASHVRVTVGAPHENDWFLDALREACR